MVLGATRRIKDPAAGLHYWTNSGSGTRSLELFGLSVVDSLKSCGREAYFVPSSGPLRTAGDARCIHSLIVTTRISHINSKYARPIIGALIGPLLGRPSDHIEYPQQLAPTI